MVVPPLNRTSNGSREASTGETGIAGSFIEGRLSVSFTCTCWAFCSAFTQHILCTFIGIARAPGFTESVWCLLLYVLQTAKHTLKRHRRGFVTPPNSIWVLRQKIDYVHPSVTNSIERLAKNSSIAATNRNLKHHPSYLSVSRAADKQLAAKRNKRIHPRSKQHG